MLAGRRAVLKPLSSILVQLWTAWEAVWCPPPPPPSLSPSFTPPIPFFFYFFAAFSDVYLYFLLPFFWTPKKNPTPSCHLLIKDFPFSFSFLFFKSLPLSFTFPVAVWAKHMQCSMKSSSLTRGPQRPQHLNSLFFPSFLPPPSSFFFFSLSLAGHGWHCQMLALINLIIRWASRVCRPGFGLSCLQPPLPSLICLRAANTSKPTLEEAKGGKKT